MSGTLWLVGMMGSGKTTIAPLVAGQLGVPWFDTDSEVEFVCDETIANLIERSVEGFRVAESQVIESLAGGDAVVACGGGAVTIPVNVATMRRSGVVVWLRARAETLTERVGDGSGRPLLGADPTANLRRIEHERQPMYRQASHVIVDCDDVSPQNVADEVVKVWMNASSGE
jgi:shikimate kinase